MTLCELVTGARPFDGDTPLATMENIAGGHERAGAAWAALPRDLAAVLARCLARAPADRFPTMAALRAELAAVRRARPPAALPDLAAWVATALAAPPPGVA